MTIESCDIVGPSAGSFDQNISGRYAVEYSIITQPVSASDPIRYIGPKQMISEAQTQTTPELSVNLPKKWATYDYSTTLGDEEKDDGSFLQRFDFTVQWDSQQPGKRTLWSVLAMYDRLQPGMSPRVDSNGDELTDPVQWPPEYKLTRLTIGDELLGGWPRDSINGGTKYGPFTTSSWPDPGLPGGTLEPIGGVGRIPITTANNLPPSNFVRVNVDVPVIICRMWFDTLERFYLVDLEAQQTVYNGGGHWEPNGGVGAGNQVPKEFFGMPWGFAKYIGGDIIGAKLNDNGLVYYQAEFRYQLSSLRDELKVINSADDTIMDATGAIQVYVKNESNITGTGDGSWQAITINDLNGNVISTSQPFPLGLDGDREANDQPNFLRYWYGRGSDYGIMGNGVHEVGYDWPDTLRTTNLVP